MASVSFRIYLTANILVALVTLFLGLPNAEAIMISLMVFAYSLLFNIPTGFALYFCFKLTEAATENVQKRWILYHVFLLLIAFIPYIFCCGVFSGELLNTELLNLLYFIEGVAITASLINCIAIHRLFKNSSHENN